MRRTETPKSIRIKFCTVVDIPDVVNYTNFGDNRLRGFWVAGGQISPSPIDFHRRPYNTLTVRACDYALRLVIAPEYFHCSCMCSGLLKENMYMCVYMYVCIKT